MTITLSQLIDQVREELLEPRQAKTEESMYPFLFVDEIELEVGIKVSSGVDGSAKVSIKVVEAGIGANLLGEETHKLKVKLTPLYTKEEIRKQLEEQLGTRIMKHVHETSLKGTAKDLFTSKSE
jgi:hypothetical protein